MIRKLLILLCIFCATDATARENGVPPDIKAIREAVADESSAYFYPRLMQQYLAGDTSLNLEEKRHLYYGYREPSDLPGGKLTGHDDSIRAILKHETLLEADYIRLLAYTDSSLAESPFHLRTLNYRFFAARKLGYIDTMRRTGARIHIVLDAILSTGDGKSIPTAYWVTEVSHEYFLLNVLDLEFGGSQSLVDGPCDFLTVKENKEGLKGVYFNVSISFDKMSEMLKDAKLSLPGEGKKKRR